jgi:hypothetical protein
MSIARPDLDPELLALLAEIPDAPPLSEETLEAIRPYSTIPAEIALAGHDVERQDLTVASYDGGQVPLTILKPARVDGTGHTAALRLLVTRWRHGDGRPLLPGGLAAGATLLARDRGGPRSSLRY